MAVYEGQEVTSDYLLEVARACAVAAARVPGLTGNLALKMKIITGEDLKPMINVLDTLGKSSRFQEADAVTYSKLKDSGDIPPVLLLGADLTKPIGWNCGACGFSTCAEFLKYLQAHMGVGAGAYCPSCLWKVIDLGMAGDQACACAAGYRVDARIQMSMGAIAMLMGHLEDCSCVLALPLGPAGSNIWFDRQALAGLNNYETIRQTLASGGPGLRLAFTGGGTPILKTKQAWWEEPTYLKVEQDEEIGEREIENKAAAVEQVIAFRAGLENEEEAK